MKTSFEIVLVVQTLLPALACGACTLAARRSRMASIPAWAHQLLVGLLFGVIACFATETGMPVVDGGVVNVRDAAPIVAGLAFGAPAGVIAGAIGGLERWLCVLWGGGATTQLACSLATFVAGASAALMRKLVFDDRRPAFGYALGIGVTTEVLHMLLILVTNMANIAVAFEYVRACSALMICLNGAACGLALLGQGYVNHERLRGAPPHLINDLVRRLIAVIAVALVAVVFFTVQITGALSASQTQNLLAVNLDDVSSTTQVFGWEKYLRGEYSYRVERTGGVLFVNADTDTVLSAKKRGRSLDDAGVTQGFPADPATGEIFRAQVFGKSCYCLGRAMGGVVAVAYVPVDEAGYFAGVTLYLMIFMEILVLTALFVLMYQLMRRRMVDKLAAVERGLDSIAAGNLDTPIDVRSHREFAVLSDNINATVDALKGYIDEAEHRMEADLALARDIQHAALPSVFPPYPDRRDFDLFASMDAAREVGGDFYDFFMPDAATLVFCIADVSGKGVPAALFMMRAKTELRTLMESGMDVDEAMTEANRRLCESNESGMFVTAWLARLDLATGTLAYANAGHNPPLIRHGNGHYEYLRAERPNLFLAGMDGVRYRKHTVGLEPGDRVFLYTDGVTEAQDADEGLFGEDRLRCVLDNAGDDEPRTTCEAVRAAVEDFAAGAERADDITMLSLFLRALTSRDRIVTAADLDSVELVRTFFENRLRALGAGARTANRVLVVMDELYSNICRYSTATRAVSSLSRAGDGLLVEFADNGVPFDPVAAPEPDTALGADERPIGGLGIHMARRMSKRMEYRRVGDTNILTIAFDL